MSRSAWREHRNEEARARLVRAMPAVFPHAVRQHAFAKSLVPPLPRLAIESYWRAHPLRADRLARALAALSGAPAEWRWRLSTDPDDGRPRTFRSPPAPFRESAFDPGAGTCCVCGQPVFRFGWHRDLWGDGTPNRRATWHACCVAAWKLWAAPLDHTKVLRRLQRRACGITGQRLSRIAEVDHRVPLSTVWRDERDAAWPGQLRFWGFPNLQAVNKTAHAGKTAEEATRRARLRSVAAADPSRPDSRDPGGVMS